MGEVGIAAQWSCFQHDSEALESHWGDTLVLSETRLSQQVPEHHPGMMPALLGHTGIDIITCWPRHAQRHTHTHFSGLLPPANWQASERITWSLPAISGHLVSLFCGIWHIGLICLLEKQLMLFLTKAPRNSFSLSMLSQCKHHYSWQRYSNTRQRLHMPEYDMIPVMPGVSNGPVTAQFVTLQLVECMLTVRVFSSLQQLGWHIGLLIKTPQATFFCLWWPRYLKERWKSVLWEGGFAGHICTCNHFL